MDFEQERRQMVREHIHARGVRDVRVLESMSAVPREKFVPVPMQAQAYEDRPLPIGHEQTISQPYIVAFMVEALQLKAGDRVLEVGAGCGYAAAVMAEIASDVYTIERLEPLAVTAANNLLDAGYKNVHVRHGDGTLGWQDAGPFAAILVSAGGPKIPDSLLRQLQIGGRLVIPIGASRIAQELVRITRRAEDEFDREDLADVRFVPLIGSEGWEGGEVEAEPARVIQAQPRTSAGLPASLAETGVVFDDLEDADLDPLARKHW